jgi:hypothetical protein
VSSFPPIAASWSGFKRINRGGLMINVFIATHHPQGAISIFDNTA